MNGSAGGGAGCERLAASIAPSRPEGCCSDRAIQPAISAPPYGIAPRPAVGMCTAHCCGGGGGGGGAAADEKFNPPNPASMPPSAELFRQAAQAEPPPKSNRSVAGATVAFEATAGLADKTPENKPSIKSLPTHSDSSCGGFAMLPSSPGTVASAVNANNFVWATCFFSDNLTMSSSHAFSSFSSFCLLSCAAVSCFETSSNSRCNGCNVFCNWVLSFCISPLIFSICCSSCCISAIRRSNASAAFWPSSGGAA
mmetsp:Transcript_34380/g.76950  ORF Transcript_34380/g.76950 Transcript_34380/m.76950 type:complete len:254 (-) Transcript_34380:86-847(-)